MYLREEIQWKNTHVSKKMNFLGMFFMKKKNEKIEKKMKKTKKKEKQEKNKNKNRQNKRINKTKEKANQESYEISKTSEL